MRRRRTVTIGFQARRWRLPLSACVTALLIAPAGRAQTRDPTVAGDGEAPVIPVHVADAAATPAESASGSASGPPEVLEEVIVTATKRQESERSIPISVNAYKAEDLEREGATDAERILAKSPGVILNKGSSPDQNYVSIRGVSSDSRNNINTRPTGLFLGDVSLSNPSTLSVLADVDITDLSTVEVLKGPQGTLFGGSALSGAIRYIPNEPALGEFHTRFSLAGGDLASSRQTPYAFAEMLNVPVGESLAFRESGVHRRNAGFIDDTTSGEKDINHSIADQFRPALLWQPFDELKVEASYFYRTVDAANGGLLNDVKDREVTDRRSASPSDSKVQLPGLRAEWDFDSSRIVALASDLIIYGTTTSDLDPGLGLSSTTIQAYQPYVSHVKQPTYELRWVSSEPFLGVNYLFGAFYMRSQQQLALHTTVANPAGSLVSVTDPAITQLGDALGVPLNSLSEVTSDVYIHALATEQAYFFDLSRELIDDVTLELGGRYYNELTVGTTDSAVDGVPDPQLPVQTVLSTVDTNQRDKGFNPKAAITWKASDNISLYTSAVRGFRFGGINAVAGYEAAALSVPTSFKSDSLWNYEVGVRTDWFGHQLIADVTGFYIDWKNPQVLQLKAGAIGYTDNVGGARIQGVETNFRARLPFHFLAGLGGSYIDARTTQPFDSAAGEIPSGSRLPSTPYVTANSSLSCSGSVWGAALLGSYSVTYQGPTHNTLQNDYPLGGYALQNLAFNVALPDAATTEINLSVTNLTDHRAAALALVSAGGVQFASIAPRTIMLTLSFAY